MNAVGDDLSTKVQLLADIQTLFNRHGIGPLASAAICSDLEEMEDRPWPEWRNGKPISTRQLARQLGHFNIKPKQIWINGRNRHGYELTQFRDAFERYIPPVGSARTLDARDTAAFREFPSFEGLSCVV